MAQKQPLPDENQGSLLDVNMPDNNFRNLTVTAVENPDLNPTEASEEVVTTEERSAEATDLRQRAGHLLIALEAIGDEKMAIGGRKYVKTPEGEAAYSKRYRGLEPIIEAEQNFRVPTAGKRARDEFVKAYKLGFAEDTRVAEEDITDEYTQFHHRYSDPANRRKFRAQLRRTLKSLSGMPPVQPDTYSVNFKPEVERSDEEELELLDSRNRMIAIRDAAGFLPANHNQKTLAFTMLNFLDHDMEPGGVYSYLRSVADHQISVFSKKEGVTYGQAKAEGKRAVTSIMHEMADHIMDARRTIDQLQRAKQVLDESPNPAITLAEALEDHPEIEAGFNEYIRYIDLKRLRETGEAPMPFSPLGPKRNEDQSVLREGQNKRLDDPYTGAVRPEAAAEYVQEQLGSVRVVTARKQWPEIIENEYKKLDFFIRVMDDIRAPYQREAQEILATVRPGANDAA